MNKLLRGFLNLKNRFKRIARNFRGSSRDPFLCLRLISVFLFIFFFLGAGPLINNLCQKRDFSFAVLPEISQENSGEYLFADPTRKIQPESPELLFVSQNSLRAAVPPSEFSPKVLGALAKGEEIQEQDFKNAIVEYIVESGDSFSLIAQKFNISIQTILWANDLSKNSTLQIGQKLVNKGYGMIYFFNDEEMVILNKISNKITEMKEEYKKAISLWDKYLLSFIETSGKI